MVRIRAIVFDVRRNADLSRRPGGRNLREVRARPRRQVARRIDHHRFSRGHEKLRAAHEGLHPQRRQRSLLGWKQVVKRSMHDNAFADPAAFEAFFEAVYLHYSKADAWGIYPEVLEVLEALRDHPVDLVVLSNWDARLHTVLDGSGLGEYLPKRFISAELGWEKPDPAIYRHVAEIMRLSPGSNAQHWRRPEERCRGPRKGRAGRRRRSNGPSAIFGRRFGRSPSVSSCLLVPRLCLGNGLAEAIPSPILAHRELNARDGISR